MNKWQTGFLRDEEGALVVSEGDGTWLSGFVRGEDGSLVIKGGSGGSAGGGGSLSAKTVESFGAKGDVKVVMDGKITSGQKTFESATASFTPADVGKTLMIRGAGSETNFHAYTGIIESVTNSTTIVMTVAASTTIENAAVVYGTDDTEAFKTAIEKLVEEGISNGTYEGELTCNRRYMLAGSPTLGGDTKGNAQVPVPIVDSQLPKFKFTLNCAGWGAALQHWNQTHPQIVGTCFVSSLVQPESDGTYHAASVLGGPTNMGEDPHGGNGFSNMLFGIKGSLTVITHRNPKHIGVDLRQIAQADVDHLSVLTLAAPGEMWSDVTGNSFAGFSNGLRMPEFFNNDLSRVTSLSVEGFSFGVVVGDHCHIDRLATIYCNVCLYTNPTVVQHGLSIGNWSAEYGQSIMLCEGQAGAKYPVTIQRLDVEEMQAEKQFVDSENVLRGTVQWAEQKSAAPTKTGAENLKITDNNNE